ncbi:MAG: hypothetical protein RLZZ618_4061 [Pseudomonadota bacterium]|jgi:hypothetical protein
MAKPSRLHTEILSVAETRGVVYFLLNSVDPDEEGEGVGSIRASSDVRATKVISHEVLSASDPVRVMWASPSGHLWTGSAGGLIATTAPVAWPAYTGPAQYAGRLGEANWSVTPLTKTLPGGTKPPKPSLWGPGYEIDVCSLWGIDDDHVFAGTAKGDIFFGGKNGWAHVFDGQGLKAEGVYALGGSSPDDVYAGSLKQLLHFNGKSWNKLKVPGVPKGADEAYMGVHTLPNGEVLVIGVWDGSRILYGRADSLTEFGAYKQQMRSITPLNDNRLMFATTEGVAELVGHKVKIVEKRHATLSSFAGGGRVFFIEEDQRKPTFVEYDPRNADKPWAKISI